MSNKILKKINNINCLEDKKKNIGKKCKYCNNLLDIRTIQVRSADEGMTTFYRCNNCNITFKLD